MSFVPPPRPPIRALSTPRRAWRWCRIGLWSLGWAAVGAWVVGQGRWPG